jgi:uncharacterized NAD(P)/FAD-binding protein YdhS
MVTVYLQPELRIGMIGLGPRGLSVLERLTTLAGADGSRRVRITVFEDGEPGCGAHPLNQPYHLMLNTIAGQLGIFPDAKALSDVNGMPGKGGQDFLTWCRSQEILVDEDGVPCASGRLVEPTDFLPRCLLGAYLAHSFHSIIATLSRNVSVTLRRERAAGVRLGGVAGQSDCGYVIQGSAGVDVRVDRLILTTGHRILGETGTEDLRATETDAGPGDALVIEGLGLTAMDILAELTRGRGGRFLRDESESVRYIRTGKEPRLYLRSRSGLPFHTRPETSMSRQRHRPMALTSERIAALRATACDGRLDFDEDVLPLMRLEMRGAAAAARLGAGDADRVAAEEEALAGIGRKSTAALTHHLDMLEAKLGAVDCDAFLAQGLPRDVCPETYQTWFLGWITEDLAHSRRGLLVSPEKAALEVWRDLRDRLREAVDFHGLLAPSHRRFYRSWTGLINRLVAGPQKERHEDLIALVDAGIVQLLHPESPIPPGARHLGARVGRAGLLHHSSGPIADLRRLGLLRAVIAEPGLDGIETREGARAVSRSGEVLPDLWVLGPATEGSTYYNHYVPSAGSVSRAFMDAHSTAAAALQYSANRPQPTGERLEHHLCAERKIPASRRV